MGTLVEQMRYGGGQAWASLSEGWRELRARAGGALTRFRRDDRGPGEAAGSAFDRFASVGWGVMAADVRVDDDRVVVRLEAPGMSFRRELPLPQPAVAARATARYRDGVLHVDMPRLAPSGGRRIVVRGD